MGAQMNDDHALGGPASAPQPLPPPSPAPPFGSTFTGPTAAGSSVAGATWGPLPPPPPAAPPARTPRRWPWVLGGVLGVLLLVAVGAAVVVRNNRHSYPDEWDPALAPLAEFVQRAKGVDFEHPVRTVLLTDEEFDERVSPDESAMSDEDREDLGHYEAMLRALGLNGGSGSVLEQQTTVGTDGVAAFYDPSEKEIVVPAGDATSLMAQQSLVHELTHALQDQLGELDFEPSSTDEGDAFRALVEGDAQRVTTKWYESLDDDQQTELDDQTAAATGADQPDAPDDTAGEVLDGVSPAMTTGFAFPYGAGEPMVDALDADNRLDEAFDDPPRSTADVMDPDRWLQHGEPVEVDAPEVADGETALGDADTLGALNLYFMLATAMDPADALDVTDGWGGDRLQLFSDSSDRVCVRAAVTGVDGTASDALEDGVSRWVATRPDGTATSSRADDVVTLDACDPGDDAPSPLTLDVASLALVRPQIVMGWTQQGGYSFDESTCIASSLVGALEPDVFAVDEPTEQQQQQIDDAVESATDACT